MSDDIKGIIGVFSLLVIAGIFTVAVRSGSQTGSIITSTFGGFSQALGVAMGGSTTGIGVSTGIQ